MSSKLYDVLNEVEKGRQNCIKNAKTANLPATDNMSIYSLGELFLEQNNPTPVDAPPQYEWERPEDWWDTKTILANAQERDGLYPAYIILLNDDESTINLTQTGLTTHQLQGSGFLLSDGTWYLASDSGASSHTWDTTFDKPCSEGYNTRYILVYVDSRTTGKTMSFVNLPALEVIFGNMTITAMYFGAYNSNYANNNKAIRNIETTTDTVMPTLTDYNSNSNIAIFKNLPNLENLYLPTLTSFNTYYGDIFIFDNLINFNLPNLENAQRIGSNTDSGTFFRSSRTKEINLPKLTSVTPGAVLFSYCYQLKNVSLPLLETISHKSARQDLSYVFQYCPNLRSVRLPALKDIYGFLNDNSTFLEEIDLPNLETQNGSANWINNTNFIKRVNLPKLSTTSGLPYILTSGNASNSRITSLTFGADTLTVSGTPTNISYSYLYSVQSLKVAKIPSATTYTIYAPNLITLELPSDWVANLTLTTPRINHNSMLNVLNALADLSETGTTHTVNFGTKADGTTRKITELNTEEIAIATDKGWTIS